MGFDFPVQLIKFLLRRPYGHIPACDAGAIAFLIMAELNGNGKRRFLIPHDIVFRKKEIHGFPEALHGIADGMVIGKQPFSQRRRFAAIPDLFKALLKNIAEAIVIAIFGTARINIPI